MGDDVVELKYKGKHIDVMQFPYGSHTVEMSIVPEAVAALVLAWKDRRPMMCLVKQYRPVISECTFEIPAGCMDKAGENSEQAIIRELQEEAGIKPEDIKHISLMYKYYPMVGSCPNTISIYMVVANADPVDTAIDDEAVYATLWMTPAEALVNVQKGAIKDGKTIIAIQHAVSIINDLSILTELHDAM